MAKTKSKKTSGKLSKVLRAFNPRSFRGGMALFMLMFAVIGGSYMAYRSFAASNPPIVVNSHARTFIENPYSSTDVQRIQRINQDGTGLNDVISNTYTQPSSSGKDISDGRYSPDRTKLAWIETAYTNHTPTGSVLKVKGLSSQSKAISSFPLPQSETGWGAPELVWYPDNSSILLPVYSTTTWKRSFKKLTLAISQFATILEIPGDNVNLTSYDLLGDEKTIVYSTHEEKGVKYYRPGMNAPSTANTDGDYCNNMRRRPGTIDQFGYQCTVSGEEHIYRQKIGGTPISIVGKSQYSAGSGSKTWINSLAWSPDGKTIALNVVDAYFTYPDNCYFDQKDRVFTKKLGTTAKQSIVVSERSKVRGCKGGGPSDQSVISWSPDGLFIASTFLNPSSDNNLGPRQVGVVNLSNNTVNKLSPNHVSSISW